jgi:hypothetical protein
LAVAEPIEGGETCQTGRYRTPVSFKKKWKIGIYLDEHRFGRCSSSWLHGLWLCTPVLYRLYLRVTIIEVHSRIREMGEDNICCICEDLTAGVKGCS